MSKPAPVKDAHLKVNGKWLWCVLYEDTSIVSFVDDTCKEEISRVKACEALVKVHISAPSITFATPIS